MSALFFDSRVAARVLAKLKSENAVGAGKLEEHVKSAAADFTRLLLRRAQGHDVEAPLEILRARVKNLEATGAILVAGALQDALGEVLVEAIEKVLGPFDVARFEEPPAVDPVPPAPTEPTPPPVN